MRVESVPRCDRHAQEVVLQIQCFDRCFTARNRSRTAKKSRFGLYSSGFSATRFLTKAKMLGKNRGARVRAVRLDLWGLRPHMASDESSIPHCEEVRPHVFAVCVLLPAARVAVRTMTPFDHRQSDMSTAAVTLLQCKPNDAPIGAF